MHLRIPSSLGLALLLLTSGCEERPDQHGVESSIAIQLLSMLKQRDYLSMERPTNFAQVFIEHKSGGVYPYDWHRKLEQFGKEAGFEQSFYEKYVVLPPGLTNFLPSGYHGEPVLLTAKPFKDRDGTPTRILISKIGIPEMRYGYYFPPETKVIDMFARANIPIPKPEYFPPPPPPSPEQLARLNWRPSYGPTEWVRVLCGRIASRVGLSEGHWPTVLFLFAVLVVLIFALSWYGLRRARN